MASTNEKDIPEGGNFAVKKPPVIAVCELEKILDKRFAVLATADQISKMSQRISQNEEDISDIKVEIRQINKKLTDKSNERPLFNGPIVMNCPNAMGPGRKMSYLISRRSIRAWPIEGDSDTELRESFEAFAREAL